MKPSTPLGKCLVVALGFAAAAAAAGLAVVLRQRLVDPADAQASGGMQAEGDAMLGAVVFGGAGAMPLALGLYWLRAVKTVWRLAAWTAVAVAVTTPFSYYAFYAPGRSVWLMIFGLRVLAAPLIAGFWLIWGLCAPEKRERRMLLGAALAEAALFLVWLTLTVLRTV